MRRFTGGLVGVVCAGLGALLAACAGQQHQAALDELCRFGHREPPFLVAYYSKQAVLVSGDIRPDLWKEEQSSIPSAYAKPATPLYEQTRRKDCYNEAEKYWYPCTETVEVDLSKHGAIIRGMSIDRAAQDAVTYCNREVQKAIPPVDDQSLTSAAYRCEVVARASCPIE